MTGRNDGPASPAAERADDAPPVDPSVARMAQAARRLADDASVTPPASARWGRLQIERVRRTRRRRRRTLALAVAVTVLLPLLVTTAWFARGWLPGRDLRYQLDGAAATGEGGYIHDVGAAGARLRFTDGTVVWLGVGARAWIVSRGPDGARLRLEGGRARFDVVHRPGARWSVDAGPFVVRVTGTAFDVAWDGGDESLEVNLWRGAVEVRGPLAERGVVLWPGQRLRVGVRDKKLDLASSDRVTPPSGAEATSPAPPAASAPDVGDAGAAPDSGSVEPPSDAQPASPPAAPTSPPVHWPHAPAMGTRVHPARAIRVADAEAGAPPASASWPARVGAGEFRPVLDEARVAGFGRCAAACSIEALSALADAARYAGRSALARDLLLAERERFAGSPEASAAAFLLGRIADDDRAEGRAEAITWYDRYLAEAPNGVYGAEALARQMLAVDALGDRPRARRLAMDYLRRFPTGPYVPQAAALVRRP
jgi:ferric-dicitrate binding protein FerR (iron transport regulator)